MKNNIETLIEQLITAIPEIKAAIVEDINTNLIAKASETPNIDFERVLISTGVAYLSMLKLINEFEMKKIDQLYIKGETGYVFIVQIDSNRILLARTTLDVRFGLILLDLKRTVEKIAMIPYSMPKRKITLENKLNEIEDEFRENYRIFFSYAKSDSEYFQIKQVGEYLERNFNQVEVMYFEKSKLAGEDILDYMERGVNWCNVFVWFHSENSLKSQAVVKEYKMATYLGKDIISITEDFNALPLSARVTWALVYDKRIPKLCQTLINDIKEYDLKKSKQQFSLNLEP